ncbi:MAG TPA: hypothetical protein VGX76_19025 [Pirellulales bacterium]|jgi:anti-sigma-K factor RskA|nr:hypothetical protein [Pirellulales bacterium]
MLGELIGYLLEALDGDEHRRVAQRLESDREARRQLECLRRLLVPLEACGKNIEAPAGLAVRTCVLMLQARGCGDEEEMGG